MGSLADKTIGDIARALGHYKPVAITIGIILAVIVALPGPRQIAGDALASVPPPVQPAPSPGDATAAPPVTEPAPPADSGSTFDSSASSSPSSSSSFRSTSSGGSTTPTTSSSGGSDSGSSSSDFDSDDSSFGSSEDFASSDEEEEEVPLRVVASAWASRTGGTPVGSTGVPEGTLPVGKRIGQRDKISFIRLDGTETSLTLAEDAATTRTTTGAVVISACQITEPGWKEATNLTFDQAPKFDEKNCVAGTRAAGVWTFDLTAFPTRSDMRGFALVPLGESVDYQVNFKRS